MIRPWMLAAAAIGVGAQACVADPPIQERTISVKGKASPRPLPDRTPAPAPERTYSPIVPQDHVGTIAGNGSAGFADGRGWDARFFEPHGLAVDAEGNAYVADSENHAVRKLQLAPPRP